MTGVTITDTENERRFVIHMPFAVPTLSAAIDYAARITHILGFAPEIDAGETTITREGDQQNHIRILCDKRISGQERCAYRANHTGICGPGN